MSGGPPDKHDAPYPDLNDQPANKTLEELIADARRSELANALRFTWEQFESEMALRDGTVRCLEIKDVVRKMLMGEL